MQPVCQFVGCNRQVFADACCDLHYNKTCRALKDKMSANSNTGQPLTLDLDLDSWIFVLTLTLLLLLAGLTVYHNHPLINGNRVLLSFICNKRKREEEELLKAEIEEFNARVAPLQAKAEAARTAANAAHDRKKQDYEAAVEATRTAKAFRDCHAQAVAALEGSASPALATLSKTLVEANSAYNTSKGKVAAAKNILSSAESAENAALQEIQTTLEDDIRTLAGLPPSGPVITEADD